MCVHTRMHVCVSVKFHQALFVIFIPVKFSIFIETFYLLIHVVTANRHLRLDNECPLANHCHNPAHESLETINTM